MVDQEKNVNLYEILNLDPFCSDRDIKQSYANLSLIYHPDKLPLSVSDEAKILFNDCSRAYKILSDPFLRYVYDLYGDFGIHHYESNSKKFEKLKNSFNSNLSPTQKKKIKQKIDFEMGKMVYFVNKTGENQLNFNQNKHLIIVLSLDQVVGQEKVKYIAQQLHTKLNYYNPRVIIHKMNFNITSNLPLFHVFHFDHPLLRSWIHNQGMIPFESWVNFGSQIDSGRSLNHCSFTIKTKILNDKLHIRYHVYYDLEKFRNQLFLNYNTKGYGKFGLQFYEKKFGINHNVTLYKTTTLNMYINGNRSIDNFRLDPLKMSIKHNLSTNISISLSQNIQKKLPQKLRINYSLTKRFSLFARTSSRYLFGFTGFEFGFKYKTKNHWHAGVSFYLDSAHFYGYKFNLSFYDFRLELPIIMSHFQATTSIFFKLLLGSICSLALITSITLYSTKKKKQITKISNEVQVKCNEITNLLEDKKHDKHFFPQQLTISEFTIMDAIIYPKLLKNAAPSNNNLQRLNGIIDITYFLSILSSDKGLNICLLRTPWYQLFKNYEMHAGELLVKITYSYKNKQYEKTCTLKDDIAIGKQQDVAYFESTIASIKNYLFNATNLKLIIQSKTNNLYIVKLKMVFDLSNNIFFVSDQIPCF